MQQKAWGKECIPHLEDGSSLFPDGVLFKTIGQMLCILLWFPETRQFSPGKLCEEDFPSTCKAVSLQTRSICLRCERAFSGNLFYSLAWYRSALRIWLLVAVLSPKMIHQGVPVVYYKYPEETQHITSIKKPPTMVLAAGKIALTGGVGACHRMKQKMLVMFTCSTSRLWSLEGWYSPTCL